MDMVAAVPQQAGERVLPSGNIAFLFSDIVGSTVRWESDPETMRLDVRRHDTLLRQAIESNGGVVFKTVGDAFCAAFSDVQSGMRAAIDAQVAIAAEPFACAGGISVRMALHAGDAEERDWDYFGPTLNRVARLLAVGHGGQILLSNAVVDAAGGVFPCGATARDLGYHRLKDLTAAEHVFQLHVPELIAEFEPLKSLNYLSHNLPQQTTSFIGREEDVADIRALLQQARLVTLSGAGGIGKTRCALQAGAELLEEYADGVWFIDLAPVRDANLVASTIGRVFELRETPNQSPNDILAHHLKNKQLLLIFDNCEQVVSEASRIAGSLLRECPNVRILATSREALNIAGEKLHRIPSLCVPPVEIKALTAAAALGFSAVALFQERAQSANPLFSVTDANALTIAQICRRLDGIPLAIELAAARLRILAPAQLLEKLNERFRVLAGGDRAALPRQQTMRALIDWSFDLLCEREQSVFRQVSIFADGFTLETAAGVCANEELDELDLVDIIQSLCDKSLVLAEPHGESMRYRLLESMNAYGREKLAACANANETAERHAETFARFVECLEERHEMLTPQEWLLQGESEIENLRSALTYSFSTKGNPLPGQRIAVVLPRIFGVLAATEGLRWVHAAMQRVNDETPREIVAGLELAHASLASVFNQFGNALSAAQRALDLYVALDRPTGVADALRLAGRSLVYLGRVEEGENLLQEALNNRRARGSSRIGGILADLAVARAYQNDLPGARALFARASAMYEEREDASKIAVTAATLAEAEFAGGNAREAVRLAEEALASARVLGRFRTAEVILGNLAAYNVELGEFDAARAAAREALEILQNQTDAISVVFDVQHLAAVAGLKAWSDAESALEQRMRAARLLGFVQKRLAVLEVEREYTEQCGYTKLLGELCMVFKPEELQPVMDDGAGWSEEKAISEALQI